jgi:hypothetical protein
MEDSGGKAEHASRTHPPLSILRKNGGPVFQSLPQLFHIVIRRKPAMDKVFRLHWNCQHFSS